MSVEGPPRVLFSSYGAGVNVSTGVVGIAVRELGETFHVETLVFAWDGKERGTVLEQNAASSIEGGLENHFEAIRRAVDVADLGA